MLKVLLYGLAVLMENGIGIWIFEEMFPKRKTLEKKHYVSEGLLYTLLFIGGYTLSCLFWGKSNIERLKNYFILAYISIAVIIYVYKKLKKIPRQCEIKSLQIF